MSLPDFSQSSLFALLLTACVTMATCIISAVQGYVNMKIENFDKIYHSLVDFTEKRAEILKGCNKLVEELADALPEKVEKKSGKEWRKLCYSTYRGINELLTEYSKCLELMMSFSHYLYKDKPVIPVVTAECWSVLYLYEKFVTIDKDSEYDIQYTQIVAPVQFIKTYGQRGDKIQLSEYLKRNKVSGLPGEQKSDKNRF